MNTEDEKPCSLCGGLHGAGEEVPEKIHPDLDALGCRVARVAYRVVDDLTALVAELQRRVGAARCLKLCTNCELESWAASLLRYDASRVVEVLPKMLERFRL